MKDILLSSPVFYLYLAFVVVLLIAALWTRQPGPAVGKPRAAANDGTGIGGALVAARCNLNRAPWRGPPRNPGATARPFFSLQATPVRGALEVDRAEAMGVPAPFIVAFRRGGDVAAYARPTPASCAPSPSRWYGGLDRPEGEDGAVD
jgi:hypothetical protein